MTNRQDEIFERLSLIPPGADPPFDKDDFFASGDALVPSINPTTGEVLAHVQPTAMDRYDRVVERARTAFETWRLVPAPVRGTLIRDLGDAFREMKEPLGELVSREMGKIRQEGLGEVQEAIDICDYAVGLSRQLYGKTMHSERPMHRMYEQWHPLGIVGVISAFNFPVAVWAWNAIIAATTGNTVVWKPAPSTPLTAVAVQKICNRIMRKHNMGGLFNLILDRNGELGRIMTEDRRVPLISFTGSTRTGREVATMVAARFGKTILELGGNNAVVATKHADMDLLVPAVLFGAVGTAGQRCTSTRRVLAHVDIIDDLIERLTAAYRQVTIGDPLDEKTLMGPLHSDTAVSRMMETLARAEAEGGTLLFGGERRPDLGARFVTPAIVRMPRQTDIVCKETFAPILYILPWQTLDDAIALQNAVPQGLSSAIFTTNLLEAETFLAHAGSDCGIANVNIGTSGAEIGGAFGGEKETGGGREAGSDAWQAYMRRQTTTINWSKALPLAQGITFRIDDKND